MRPLKFGLALLIVVFLTGIVGNQRSILAQDAQPQTFIVQAGGHGAGNIEIEAFMPAALQIHQGDTVIWQINGFHNIRFGEPITNPVLLPPAIDIPQLNPLIAVTAVESGGTYTGGELTSGFPTLSGEYHHQYQTQTYSLVMDLEPGSYAYLSDFHFGMMGTIEVVADDVEIPSPAEAAAVGAAEFAAYVGPTLAAIEPLMENQQPATADENGVANIKVGTGASEFPHVYVEAFFPPVAIIQAGQTITWTLPPDSLEANTIASSNFEGNDFDIIPQDNAAPIFALGTDYIPVGENGGSIAAGDVFNSAVLFGGQSYSLTFTEPGVYPFHSTFFPGQTGVVIVQPAE